MSSVASSSVGNMPPRHGKKLADVLDEAFKSNNKREDDGEDEKSEAGARGEAPPLQQEEPAQPLIKQVHGYSTMSAVYPPEPCERCVRSKKTCKGIAGARCEHCKSLHQKCSNSTGPPRGRHAGKFPSPPRPPRVENGKAGTSSAPRPKRKASNAKSKLNEAGDEEDDDEDDEEEDGDEKTAPARKKRRAGSDRRSRLLKDVGELEGTIKKFQATFAKDLTKLQQTAASLAAQIRDMDS